MAKKNNLKKKNEYYMKKPLITTVVNNFLRKNKGILHGARALNIHLPSHLDKHTEDYDIYNKKAEQKAKELEKQLDKRFEGDYFSVSEGKHKGTWKVKSNVTNKTVADISTPRGKVAHKTSIENINYARLQYLKRKLQRILRNKEFEFRHARDRETLQRIKIYEKVYGEEKW